MLGSPVSAAVDAAIAAARALGLRADDAVILQDANRAALRLLPCDVLARVGAAAHREGMRRETAVVRQLAATGAPVAGLEPRGSWQVYEQDGFFVSFWTFFEPIDEPLSPARQAASLHQLHAAFRSLDFPAPHFTDRVAEAVRIVEDPGRSPELAQTDRTLLQDSLPKLTQLIQQRASAEQLLHGEPHPGNLLNTAAGALFIDFETCCRGPVEFDIAHADDAVAVHYANADQGLVALCRALKLAMVAAWRWDKDDHFPGGRSMGLEFTSQLREAMRAYNLDAMS